MFSIMVLFYLSALLHQSVNCREFPAYAIASQLPMSQNTENYENFWWAKGNDTHVYALYFRSMVGYHLKPDGSWEVMWNTSTSTLAPEHGARGGLCEDKNNIYYFTSWQKFAAFRKSDGHLLYHEAVLSAFARHPCFPPYDDISILQTDSVVHAFRTSTGQQIWQSIPQTHNVNYRFQNGINQCDDSSLYGIVVCTAAFSPHNHTELDSRYELLEPPAEPLDNLVALNRSTGKTLWNISGDFRGRYGGHTFTPRISREERIVTVQCGGDDWGVRAMAFDFTGAKLWEIPDMGFRFTWWHFHHRSHVIFLHSHGLVARNVTTGGSQWVVPFPKGSVQRWTFSPMKELLVVALKTFPTQLICVYHLTKEHATLIFQHEVQTTSNDFYVEFLDDSFVYSDRMNFTFVFRPVSFAPPVSGEYFNQSQPVSGGAMVGLGVGTSVSAAALGSGSSSAAASGFMILQLQRLVLLNEFSDCPDIGLVTPGVTPEPLPVEMHPVGVAIGSHRTSYHLGALVFDQLILIAPVVIQFCVATGIFLFKVCTAATTDGFFTKLELFSHCLTLCKFPKANLLWAFFFIGAIGEAGIVLAAHSDDEPWRFFIGLQGILVLIFGMFFVWLGVRHRTARFSMPPEGTEVSFCHWFWLGKGGWEPDPDDRSQRRYDMFKTIYGPLKGVARYWLVGELIISFLVCAAAGLAPQNYEGCIVQAILLFSFITPYFLLSLILFPFSSLLDNVGCCTMATFQFSVCLTSLIHIVQSPPEAQQQYTAAKAANEFLGEVGKWLGIGMLVCDCVRACVAYIQKRHPAKENDEHEGKESEEKKVEILNDNHSNSPSREQLEAADDWFYDEDIEGYYSASCQVYYCYNENGHGWYYFPGRNEWWDPQSEGNPP